MYTTMQTARRATTGRNALTTLAVVFIAASLVFWGVLNWAVFYAPHPGVSQALVAAVMTIIYALALPLLLSILVPTTPAGQYLQKTQWRTVGFPVIVAGAAFLAWHARNLMLSWFVAQPIVAEAHLENAYTIAALIGFVLIPALSWVQVSPERWIAEAQQAHLVKKLELEQQGELAIIKARLLWAEQKAAIGYARLLPAEQKEVRDTLRGLLMGIADTQRGIARTMGIQGDLEQSIMGDQEIADSLHYVERQLVKPAASIERAMTYFDDAERLEGDQNPDRGGHAIGNDRLQSVEPRQPQDAPGRPRTPAADREYSIAIEHLRKPVWLAQDLADVLSIDKTTAQKKARTWIAQERVEETRLGHYRFTESERA